MKEVSADSEEAKKWPLLKPPAAHHLPESSQASIEPSAGSGSNQASSSRETSAPAPLKSVKKPGPRKPKTTLAPLPGAQKAKKLTTLDKSAMDWRSHVDSAQQSSSGIKDELDANRRGGGYLEKVEFLQRVEQRKEEALEANKATKRRRG